MAVRRPCITCGTICSATRCPPCAAAYDRQRTARRGNRYGGEHQRLRELWRTVVDRGGVTCARCGTEIVGAFDLDHMPDGTSRPSHPGCNRAAHR